MSKLEIGVSARADFGEIDREGLAASQKLRRQFANVSKEAGKLGRIKIPHEQFVRAGKELDAIAARMKQLERTEWGRGLAGRARSAGFDPHQPSTWDWAKMHGGNAAWGAAAQQAFYKPIQRAPGRAGVVSQAIGGAASGAVMRGAAAAGGAAAGTMGANAAGAAAGGIAAKVGGIGSAMAANPAGAAAIIAAAVVAKLGLDALKAGYGEYKQTIEPLDSLYKRGTGERPFDKLVEDARVLGNELQLTASRAAELAKEYGRASRLTDPVAIMQQVNTAGWFSRAYGLDPSVGSAQFGKAAGVGYGDDVQSQRRFAGLIGTAIESGGMQARAEQVMGDLVTGVTDIARAQGRTASEGEMSQLAGMLGTLYRNKAMSDGGAQTVLGALGGVAGPGSAMSQTLAWSAFGPAVRNSWVGVQEMMEAKPWTSPRDLGISDDPTPRALLTHETTKQFARGMDGKDEEERYAMALSQMNQTPVQVGRQIYRLLESFKPAEDSMEALTEQLKDLTAADAERDSMARLTNELVRLGDEAQWVAIKFRSIRTALTGQLANGVDFVEMASRRPGDVALSAFRGIFDAFFPPAEGAILNPKMGAVGSSVGEPIGRAIGGGAAAPGSSESPGAAPLQLMAPPAVAQPAVAPSPVAPAAPIAPSPVAPAAPIAPPPVAPAAPITPPAAGGGTLTFARSEEDALDPEFQRMLESAGMPLKIVSGRRSKERNAAVKGASKSSHLTGQAADISMKGMTDKQRANLVRTLRAAGVRRFGVYPGSDGLHVDTSKIGGDPDQNWFMYDRSNRNMGQAPQWFRDEAARPKPPPLLAAAPTSPRARVHGDKFSAPGLKIDYQGDPNFVYGKTASANAKPFSGILVHHTATESAQAAADYGKTIDPKTGYPKGYHFYIGKDGKIIQGAPLSKRTNHMVSDSPGAKRWGMRNAETIGIGLAGSGEAMTDEQRNALKNLGGALRSEFGIDPNRIRAHGEMEQKNKMESEGVEGARLLRKNAQLPRELDQAVAQGVQPQPIDARWQGQIAMDVTFRDSKGNLVAKRNAMAVSEPRVPGSVGSSSQTGNRFSWNDDVTMPA